MNKEKYFKKLSDIVLMFIIFFLPLVFFGMAADPFWVVEKFFFKFSLSILLIIYIIYFLSLKKIPAINNSLNKIFLLFLLVNIAGIIKIASIHYYLDKFVINIYYIIFFLAVLFSINEHSENKNKIILLITISVTFMALYGIFQVAGLDIFSWKSNFAGRAASTLGNPNFLAGHIVLILPFIYSLVFDKFGSKKTILLFLIAIIITYGLFITQTRGAYLAFLMSAIFMILLIFIYAKNISVKNKKFFLMGFVVILLLFGFYFLLNKNAYNRVKNIFLNQDEAVQIRLSLWKNSFNVFKDNFLLGTGAGNFPLKYSYYQASSLTPDYFKKSDFYRSSHSHNDYIQFAAEYGILGLGAILFLMFIIFKKSFNYLKAEGKEKILVSGIISGILAILIHAIFNFPFLIIPTTAYFYCLVAILLYFLNDSSVELIPLNKKIKILLILFLPVFILIMLFSFYSFLSNVYLRKAKENEYFNKIKEAFYYAEKAVKVDPFYEENYLQLAILNEKTGNSKESCKYYERIYGLNRGYWEANINLFDCYASDGLKDKMLEIGENLYKISPYSRKAIRALGLGFYINAKYKSAIKIFTEGINLYNDDYEMLTFLAIAFAADGEFDRAIENFKRAIEINPGYKDAYFNMAVAYYSFKKFKEAKDIINTIKKLGFYDEKTKNLEMVIGNEK